MVVLSVRIVWRRASMRVRFIAVGSGGEVAVGRRAISSS